MKNKEFLLCIPVLIIALTIGCIPPNQNVGKSNFLIQGQLNVSRSTSTPSNYLVMVTKFELLKSAADSSPVVVYQANSNNYALVELAKASPANLGTGSLPSATYTHCRATITAISQTIEYYDESTTDAKYKNYAMLYKDFDNSQGLLSCLPQSLISKGSVLVNESNIYNWFEIDSSKKYHYSLSKVDVTPYYADVTTDEDVQTIQLTSPITIEDGKIYTGLLTFNVADTFSYNDLNANSKFEPTSADHGGTKVNDFYFKIIMPQITCLAIER